MSEHIKHIIQELNKPPFNKQYNLITFDSLGQLPLLQVLTDVLTEIDPKQKVDVREEGADQTAIRIFGILRILKYKPPTDAQNLSQFRQGIVQGDKSVIYPILEWLLDRIPALKQRAYLARYLVKLDVPPDFIAEPDIGDLFNQYEVLIEEFKENHKQFEQLKASGYNTVDIKKDIASMEEEKDQLIRRVDRLKKKVESAPNSTPMLEVARKLRTEKDREERIQKQKYEQKNLITQLDQRIHRLQQQIKDTKQSTIGATAEGLLHKLEEETHTNNYMVKEKLPKEITLKRKAVGDLGRVVAEPAMGQSDLDGINQQIKDCNAQVNKLVEKRMMMSNPADDKLSLFRQQASIIARKKEGAATTLQETREELVKLELEAEEKRGQIKQGDGEEVLKGEEMPPVNLMEELLDTMADKQSEFVFARMRMTTCYRNNELFKRYVNKLRSKSTTYKKKRQELSELRAEAGVLARTEEILKSRDENINETLSVIEKKKGVAGYRETQDKLENISSIKSEIDNLKGRTLEDISHMVQQLNNKISAKKTALAPIIKELRPMRQRAQELTAEYNEKKQTYDTTSAGLDSNRSKLEQEVKSFREEIAMEESRFHYLSAMMKVNQLHQDRMVAELKAYRSSDPNEKKKTLREQYTRKVQEQENLGKSLREKQKYVRESQDKNVEQMKIWRDYTRLLDCKLRLVQQGGSALGSSLPAPAAHSAGGVEGDVLVL